MKLIEAIIKPFKLDDVREALTGIGVQGLTATEALVLGGKKGRRKFTEGPNMKSASCPKYGLRSPYQTIWPNK